MAFAAIKNVACECGLVLIVGQPEVREVLENLVDSLGAGYAVVLLGGSSATCPRCGKLYFLPPAESFDVERTGLAWLQDLEENGPDQEPTEPLDPDISF